MDDFQEYRNQINAQARRIVDLARDAQTNQSQTDVSKQVRDLFKEIAGASSKLSQVLVANDTDAIIDYTQLLATNGLSLGEEFKRSLDPKLKEFGSRLTAASSDLHHMIDNGPYSLAPLGSIPFDVLDTYEEALLKVKSKTGQIDDLLGHASAQTVADDYRKSADAEVLLANSMRLYSMICMGCSAITLIIAYLQISFGDFSWERTLPRIFITFLLSIPAAYFAKESAKHREQQYHYLQTSLDLKAITPFLASMEESEQSKIKAEIARKIFVGRDLSRFGKDPYPINTHEIIMELIKRLKLETVEREDKP